jgi:hypothetical protein
MKRLLLTSHIVLSFSLQAFAADLYLLKTVDLASTANSVNPEFIGSNPGAVAWNGPDLYLAGYNGSVAAANVAMVQVSGVMGTPAFGTAFGVVASTPNSRGYVGLDIIKGFIRTPG